METIKLKDICTFLNGFAFKSKLYTNDGIRVIRIANVQKGILVDTDPCFYPHDMEVEISKYLLYSNDILISLTGNVGRVACISPSFLPAALNQRVLCIRPNNTSVYFKYIYYLLQQNSFERDCRNASNGVAQLNLSPKWLADYKIPVPSLPEQTRIVEKIETLFSELDKGIDELKQAKARLKVYRQAVLKQAFEGKWIYYHRGNITNSFSAVDERSTADLAKLPEEWRYVYLNDLGELARGKSRHRPRNDARLFEEGYMPFIQTGDVKAASNTITEFSTMYGDFGVSQSKVWKSGTLCVTIAANIAETAFLGMDSCFPDSIVGFCPYESLVSVRNSIFYRGNKG